MMIAHAIFRINPAIIMPRHAIIMMNPVIV